MNFSEVHYIRWISTTFYEPNTGLKACTKIYQFFRRNIAKIAKQPATRQIEILRANSIKK